MDEVEFHFAGKNFVVVGASSGMGRQVALELADAGAHVLAIARNEEKLIEVQNNYRNLIEYFLLDVTKGDPISWENAIDEFVKKHGKIHGGVYTAGTTCTTPLRFFDKKDARNIMETGFWGAVQWLQTVTKQKYTEEKSSYVLFSSTTGHIGARGMSVYAATKAALRYAVRSFSHDLSKRHCRINTVSPGYVRTEMTLRSIEEIGVPRNVSNNHLLGIGEPSDVSGMVLFLLSNRSQWVTGTDVIVDGGSLCGAWK